MKSVWNGSLSFGLVNIPVNLIPATQPQGVSFRMLCKKCGKPLSYKRWCETHKEVAWQDVGKGLPIGKKEFIPVDEETIKHLRPEKTERIDIIAFIDAFELSPVYYHSHYYCVPERAKEKAYFLFHDVLESTAKMAIGRFVMRQKEYLCGIIAYRGGLLLTTLHYAYEVRNLEDIPALGEKVSLTKEEKELARQLIQKLTEKNFDISEFKDTFSEQIFDLIQEAQKGTPVKTRRKPKEKNLIEALRESV